MMPHELVVASRERRVLFRQDLLREWSGMNPPTAELRHLSYLRQAFGVLRTLRVELGAILSGVARARDEHERALVDWCCRWEA